MFYAGKWAVGWILAGAVLLPTGAFAQNAAPAAAPTLPLMHFSQTPVRQAVARISRESGALVVADWTVAMLPLTRDLPSGSLDAAITAIVGLLPKGVVVKRVYIPAPKTAALDGDQVAALVTAQEMLAGVRMLKPLLDGEVDILGRHLTADTAAPIIAALDLKPVYLVTNPAAAKDPVQRMMAVQKDTLKAWLTMTPEQHAAAVNEQMDSLMSMDPALRAQLFAQQRQAAQGIMDRMKSMSEEQRNQFLRDVTGGQLGNGPTSPPSSGQ